MVTMLLLLKLASLLLFSTRYVYSTSECNNIYNEEVTAYEGQSELQLQCSFDHPGTGKWFGNGGAYLDSCKETDTVKKCTISNVLLEYNDDQIEMALVSEGSCIHQCVFTIVVITEVSHTSFMRSVSFETNQYTSATHRITTTSQTTPHFSTDTTSYMSSVVTMATDTTTPDSSSSLLIATVSCAVAVLIVILLVGGAVLLWLEKRRSKGNRTGMGVAADSAHSQASGFMIGPARKDLFREYIEFREIVVEELINRGTYTLTHHAMIGTDNVTSKRLKANAPAQGINELAHEIEILKTLKQLDTSCDVLPVMVGSTHSPEPVCLVTERLPSHDLQHLLKLLLKGPLPDWYTVRCNHPSNIAQDLMSILILIAEAEKYLCDKTIVHGNLSVNSVLVGPDLTVKLHDSMPRHDGDYYISTGRSDHLQDMAPESIKEGSHTTASEVWSFGVLMFRVVTFGTRDPFSKTKPDQLLLQIQNGLRPPQLPTYSKEFHRQIQECLKFAPFDRPNFDLILHTLQILSENASQHLILNISSKKKGYIDETGSIHLFPHFNKQKNKAFRGINNHRNSSTSELSTAAESGILEDVEPKGKNRFTRGLSSLLQSKKPSHQRSDEFSTSDFEQVHLIQRDEIKRKNPLAQTNIV